MIYRVVIILVVLLFAACNDNNDQSLSQGDNLTVSITLDSLPDTVSYNKSTTPDGNVEYSWGITFDINGDGVINQGDVELQILQFKSPGSVEQVGRISALNADLWEYTTDTQTTSIARAISQVSGNTITLSIDKSAHRSLNSISSSTLVYFECSTYDANDSIPKYDYNPGFRTFVNIPIDGEFTDQQGDASFAFIDMVSMTISL